MFGFITAHITTNSVDTTSIVSVVAAALDPWDPDI
jgi:hypothetical protein